MKHFEIEFFVDNTMSTDPSEQGLKTKVFEAPEASKAIGQAREYIKTTYNCKDEKVWISNIIEQKTVDKNIQD